MELGIGMPVRSADDQEVGTIDRLVVHPETGTIIGVVLRKGPLLPQDIEVPIAMIEPEAGNRARMTCTVDKLMSLPAFSASMPEPLLDQYAPPPGYAFGSLAWPIGSNAAVTTPEHRLQEEPVQLPTKQSDD